MKRVYINVYYHQMSTRLIAKIRTIMDAYFLSNEWGENFYGLIIDNI